jgi:phosphoribosylaminoimidazolecarboxamide formyltransferase/IMP cyclohydrolase
MSPLALVSVTDKKNLIPFCKELVEQLNYKILSSGGTAKHLIEAKIPVIKVADFTNSPEILGGRVKTLHPKIHGGILAKRTDEEHKKDIEANNLELIDLVVVNLYPFKKTIDQGAKWEDAIENIDIGGPSMIRSAAKNHRDVSVLVDPSQYQNFLEESKKGELKDSFKAKLALEAFQHTADYDTAISNWIRKERDLQSSKYIESYPLIKTLRYGENPHQKAFWYGLSNIGWNSAEQLQGKDLSYNNLLDLESALSTVLEFGYTEKDELTNNIFASVILKHNNPCGASISNSASKAFLNALECDSVIKATILLPDEYLGSVIQLCTERRGIQKNLSYVGKRAMIEYLLPLSEVVFDFYDRLKSITSGYASFDYEFKEYTESDLVRVQILVNSESVDALSFVIQLDIAVS